MGEDLKIVEDLTFAAGLIDRSSPNAFDARLGAVRALFPELEMVVDLVESRGVTESGIRFGHTLLDFALAEHLSANPGIQLPIEQRE